MSLAVIHSSAPVGVTTTPVEVEVHLANGLPAFSIVGLPETAVKESKDRVRSAIINSAFEFPASRITVNLAPADLPKEGGRYDLPIAIGVLVASGQLPDQGLGTFEMIGELALSGELRRVSGALCSALACANTGRKLIVPATVAGEAALAAGAKVMGMATLLEVCGVVDGTRQIVFEGAPNIQNIDRRGPDLADVRGQEGAKRALEVAAAGGHSALFIGPPGAGKSMLAARLSGILPPLTETEALETASILSVSDRGFHVSQWRRRPFRRPHHSASAAALVGGGRRPVPGEISLAHNGVLFLDELPEFARNVLEQLREPLETGEIHISRATAHACFPARFQLVAAMNPCPCGYQGDGTQRCTCSDERVRAYRQRVSGPLLDRIDMHVQIARVTSAQMRPTSGEDASSAQVRKRVSGVRRLQLKRQGVLNSALTGKPLDRICALEESAMLLLEQSVERLHLSSRAYHRILRLARTVADLEISELIEEEHLAEAIGYRVLDRGGG